MILSFCLSFLLKKRDCLGRRAGIWAFFPDELSGALFLLCVCLEGGKEAVGVILGVSGGICLLAALNRFGFWPVDFREGRIRRFPLLGM